MTVHFQIHVQTHVLKHIYCVKDQGQIPVSAILGALDSS